MTTPLNQKDSRKEQAPRAEGSPASGERSELQDDERPKPIPGKWTAHQSENPAYPHEWDVKEGGKNGYSVIGEGFITENQAKEIELRHNLTIPPRGQQQEWTPLSLAQHFHNIYERCAPEFGYETRAETRSFNPETPNGKLMIAVCSEILRDFNAELAASEQSGFKRGLTFYERNEKTGEILVRYHEERK